LEFRRTALQEHKFRIGQTVYLSATPGPYELSQSGGEFAKADCFFTAVYPATGDLTTDVVRR
jgi:excinuclease UvrABC helicase subunit UvrB